MVKKETEEEAIKTAQMYTIAGLPMYKPLSIDTVRWAVERGFKAGRQFQANTTNSD